MRRPVRHIGAARRKKASLPPAVLGQSTPATRRESLELAHDILGEDSDTAALFDLAAQIEDWVEDYKMPEKGKAPVFKLVPKPPRLPLESADDAG